MDTCVFRIFSFMKGIHATGGTYRLHMPYATQRKRSPFDRNAIYVMDQQYRFGLKRLGSVPCELSKVLAPLIDAGQIEMLTW